MSTPADNHASIAKHFSDLVENTDDWKAQTPVREWRAHDVVEHLITWLPHVVHNWTGIELQDSPETPLPRRWALRCAELDELLNDPDKSSTSVTDGPFTGDRLDAVIDRIYTPDVFMHTWDLARATGQPIIMDAGMAQGMLEGMQGMEAMLRGSGQFGETKLTASSDPVDRLIAFIGRDPEWQRPV